jgi:hypothetical protein
MITIGFFSNNSLFCRLIQLVSGGNINHCAIGLMKDGKPMWLQASVHGVDLVDKGFLGGLVEEYQVLAEVENEVELAEKKIGTPYAYISLFGYLLMTILGWFGININNPIPEPNALFCSEYVIEALKLDPKECLPELDCLDPASISPVQLRNICASGKSFRRIYPA